MLSLFWHKSEGHLHTSFSCLWLQPRRREGLVCFSASPATSVCTHAGLEPTRTYTRRQKGRRAEKEKGRRRENGVFSSLSGLGQRRGTSSSSPSSPTVAVVSGCVCVGASLSVFLPPLRSLSLPICPLPVPERKEEREASVCMSTQYNLVLHILRTVKRRSTSLVDHALLEEQRTMHAWTLRDIRHGREGGGQTNTAAASERRKKRKGHLAD